MWLLVSASNNDVRYTILGDHKYIVGRQNCDIVVPDASVSRKQAVLTMAHYETSVVKSYITPTLTLEDLSKFGTFVNGKAVKNPGGSTVTLKHNDEVKFGGSPASVFKAIYEPFVATTSCLEKAPKKSLIKVMCLLGGHLVRDWRPMCDLLIMSKINVTIKVICAINKQKHIVTPQFLDDLYCHLMGRHDKPDPVSYLPEVVDKEVPAGVSFHPDIRRVTLLQGLKFYFLSAVQFNKTNLAVSTAGGQPILLEDGTEEEAVVMTESKTVVVAVSREILGTLTPACQKFVKLVISVLKRKNLRMVTDPEIGWAILTCNTVDFCNARSSITPDMLSYMASQTINQSTEMDTSHTGCPADVKPGNRSIADVQSQNISVIEDVKPVAKSIKPEILLPDSNNQVVKPEPLEEHIEVKPAEASVSSSEVSQSKKGQSNKLNIAPALRASESANTPPNILQPAADSLRLGKVPLGSNLGKGTLGSHQDSGTSDLPHSKTTVDSHHAKETLDSHQDKVTKNSLVAKETLVSHHAKEALDSRQKGSQHLEACGTKKDNDASKSQRRIKEDDFPDETVSVFARRQGKVRVKPQGNSLEDSGDDSPGNNNMQASKQKRGNLFADDDDVSLSKRRKTDHVARDRQKGIADSDIFVLCTDIVEENSSSSQATANQDDSDDLDIALNVNGKSGKEHGRDSKSNSSGRHPQEISVLPILSGDGWMNMATVKSKQNGALQNGDFGEDVKLDVELLRDSEGNILRNLCEVKVMELIARPVTPDVRSTSAKSSKHGEKNFKKFKKTQHTGAGRLPVIIGGRDLEVYLGSKHKDIEDLFSAGLAQETQRQEEERRERDLFDWDDRTRKTSGKRIR